MGPFAALDSVLGKFATFSGRASPSEYWWYQLMWMLIFGIAIWGDVMFFDPNVAPSLNPFSYFCVLWALITLLPSLAVIVRRLHDTDRSGAWIFIQFVPLGSLWFFVLMVLPSDRKPNYYGQPPHGQRGSAYQGYDINDLGMPVVGERKPHNPYAGYAYLEQARRGPTPEILDARREQVADYYRSRVLKQT